MGWSLDLLTRLSGSSLVEKLGLRDTLSGVLRDGSRTAIVGATKAWRSFQPMLKLTRPARPKPAEGGQQVGGLFDLTPTEEQALVRDSVRQLARDVFRPLAEAADDASEVPDEVPKMAWELGLPMMAVPEEAGGAGESRSAVTWALVAEELARGDMALAWAALAPVGVAIALAEWGSAEQQSRYLAPFAGEEPIRAALAIVEPRALFDPQLLTTRARRKPGGGYELYGEKALVPFGDRCELWLVAADLLGAGPRVFIVEAGMEGVRVEADPAMGLRGAAPSRLILEGVALPPSALLGEEDPADYEALVDRARIGWAALAVGAGQAMLDHVIPYVNDRHAFGEPISHRQGVAFLVADIAIELQGMRLLTWRAASRVDAGESFQREAFLARQQAADKGMKIGTDGVQLLGGAGFVKDHPVERWYRHLRAVGLAEGGLLV